MQIKCLSQSLQQSDLYIFVAHFGGFFCPTLMAMLNYEVSNVGVGGITRRVRNRIRNNC